MTSEQEYLEKSRKHAREGRQGAMSVPEFAARQRASYERSSARALEAMRANQEDPRHGTEYGYVVGDRCERCKAAHAIGNAGRRARQRAKAGLKPYERKPDARHAIVVEMASLGASNAEIAAATGFSRYSISSIAKRLGVPARKPGGGKAS